MTLPRCWKTAFLSLVLTGTTLGLCWTSLRERPHAGKGNRTYAAYEPYGTNTEKEPASAAKPMSSKAADMLLTRLWDSCGDWIENGVLQTQRAPLSSTSALLEDLAPEDIALLLERNESETDPARRDTLRKLLFGLCAAALPERALTIARGWPAELADEWIAPMLDAWIRQNPDAVDWFNEVKEQNPGDWNNSQRVFASDEFAAIPSGAGPGPASLADAWSQSVALMEKRDSFTWGEADIKPLHEWAERTGHWEQALEKLKAVPEHKQEGARVSFLRAWASKDWRSWLAWEDSHPERRNPDRKTARDGFCTTLNSACFDVAGRQRGDEPMDTAELSAFLNGAIKTLSGTVFLGHAELGLKAVVEQWVQSDPTQATTWLKQLEPGVLRDKAVGTVSETLSTEDPEAAFAWADSIGDPALREKTLVTCREKWRALEPGPADAWLDEHFPEVRGLAAKQPGPGQ